MVAACTPMVYRSVIDCVSTIWSEQGVTGFFSGADTPVPVSTAFIDFLPKLLGKHFCGGQFLHPQKLFVYKTI